jgi:hypothetical protein
MALTGPATLPPILVGTQAFGLGWQKRPFRPKEKLTFSVPKKRNFKTRQRGADKRVPFLSQGETGQAAKTSLAAWVAVGMFIYLMNIPTAI